MREIKNSIGQTFTISLRLPDVLRLQRGYTIEPNRVLTEDFGHSDREHLQQQVDRIMSQPAVAADFLYALLPAATRQTLSFAQFIGEDATIEPWQPKDLVIAAIILAEEVLDFFQGRIPDLAGWKMLLKISVKEARELMERCETMPPAEMEERIRNVLLTGDPIGGTIVGDLPDSPASPASTDSPIANSSNSPPETSSVNPGSPPQSAPSPPV